MSEYRRLAAEAAQLKYGREKQQLLTQAVELVQLAGDFDAEFELRTDLASSANHGGEPQVGLVNVTWCLAQIDAHPGRFPTHGTLWQLKWLPTLLVEYPTTSLAKLDELLAEVRSRFSAEGSGQDAVAKLAWLLAMRTGRLNEAVDLHAEWRQCARTPLADCRACDLSEEVSLRLACGDLDLALLAAGPLLKAGLSCAEEPALVIGQLLDPLRQMGHPMREGMAARGLSLLGNNPGLLLAAADHVRDMVRDGRHTEARQWGRRVAHWGSRTHVPSRQMSAAAAVAVCERAGIDLDTSGDEAADVARNLAEAFDRRNLNSHVSALVERWLSTVPTTESPVLEVRHSPLAQEVIASSTESVATVADRLSASRGMSPARRLALCRALHTEASGDDVLRARIERAMAGCQLSLGSSDEALKLLDGLDGRLTSPECAFDRMAVLLWRGEALADPDDASPATERSWYREAAREAELVPAPRRDEAAGELLLSSLRLQPDGARPDEAAFARARQLLAKLPDRLASVWAMEAARWLSAGEVGRAESCAQEALELAPNDGFRARVLILLISVVEQTAAVRALVLYQQARVAAAADGDAGLAAQLAHGHAQLLAWIGDHEGELAVRYDAVDEFARCQDRVAVGWMRLELGCCLRRLGRDQQAYDLWSDLLASLDDPPPHLRAAVALELARCDADADLDDDALDMVQIGLSSLDPADVVDRGQLLGLQARLVLSTDLEQGESLLDEAVESLVAGDRADAAVDVVRTVVRRLVELRHGERALARLAQVESLLGQPGPTFDRVALLVHLDRMDEARALAVRMLAETPEQCWDAARAARETGERNAAAQLFETAIALSETEGASPSRLTDLRQRAQDLLGEGEQA